MAHSFLFNLDLEEQNVDFGNIFSLQINSFLWDNYVILNQTIYVSKICSTNIYFYPIANQSTPLWLSD